MVGSGCLGGSGAAFGESSVCPGSPSLSVRGTPPLWSSVAEVYTSAMTTSTPPVFDTGGVHLDKTSPVPSLTGGGDACDLVSLSARLAGGESPSDTWSVGRSHGGLQF